MKKYFMPEKDITAYELACIVVKTTDLRDGVIIAQSQWDDEVIPFGLERHFKDKKQ